MHAVQLSALDLNLLSPLHALIEEQSVARASRRVGLSASATSHALARLRQVFDDALLMRVGRKLVRTTRAEAMRDDVRLAVHHLEGLFRPPRLLELATLRRAFRVATTDHVQLVLLRRADAILRKEAPLVDLYALPLGRGGFDDLRAREVDLTISVRDEVPNDLAKAPLFEDRLVSIARAKHPILDRRVTLSRFVEHPHVLVAPSGSPVGLVDRLLETHGLARRVARTLPTFVDAAFFVSRSDYLASLPSTLVSALGDTLRLARVPVPLDLPSFTHSMIWHRRDEADPAHAWLRSVLSRVGRDVEREASKLRGARRARR